MRSSLRFSCVFGERVMEHAGGRAINTFSTLSLVHFISLLRQLDSIPDRLSKPVIRVLKSVIKVLNGSYY
jgi:hypothetical protein